MAASMESQLDVLQTWLQEIAKNTAATRDAVEGRASGGAAPRATAVEESRFDRLGRRLEAAIGSGIGQRLGQAQGLAARGFGGTVESARYEYAMDQLGRQFAAVMKPIFDGFTYAAVEVERRFRAFGGAQQNGVMGGLVGAGLGARFGGVPGAMLGFAAGSAFMGGGDTTGAMAGAAGGAWLGARMGGPAGAVVGGIAGGVAGTPGHLEGERPFDYYDRMRRGGGSRLGAGFAMGLRSLEVLGGGIARGVGIDTDIGRGGRPGAGGPRRDVTPYSADPLAAGGTSDAIQKAVIRATAGADFEDGGPMKPVIDIGLRIIDILLAIAGGGAPAPAPARG